MQADRYQRAIRVDPGHTTNLHITSTTPGVCPGVRVLPELSVVVH